MLLCLVGVAMTYAQKESMVLHYSFKEATGTVVKDKGPHHADAKLMNGAVVKDGKLVLENEGAYLDMTEKAGKVIMGLKDFTIYTRYKVGSSVEIKGNGFFLWCFSSLPANKEKEGPYHAYRLNQQRVETSIGGWNQETGIQKNEVSAKGEWVSVIYRQKAGKGELFINGKLVGTENAFPEFANIFKAAPKCCWLGRAPFAGDRNLSKTKIADFRVYNICVSDAQVKKLHEKQIKTKKSGDGKKSSKNSSKKSSKN